MRLKDDEQKTLAWIASGMLPSALPKHHVRKLAMAGLIRSDGTLTKRGKRQTKTAVATDSAKETAAITVPAADEPAYVAPIEEAKRYAPIRRQKWKPVDDQPTVRGDGPD